MHALQLIENFIYILFNGLGIALLAFIYSDVLVSSGQLLESWRNLLYQWVRRARYLTDTHPQEYLPGEPVIVCFTWNRKVWKYEAWDFPRIYKVLIGCTQCVAGQMALWYYLIFHPGQYQWGVHLVLIALSIFAIKPYKALHSWAKRNCFS